jgi:hypothetical protein
MIKFNFLTNGCPHSSSIGSKSNKFCRLITLSADKDNVVIHISATFNFLDTISASIKSPAINDPDIIE